MSLPSGQGVVMAPSVAGPLPRAISHDQLHSIASARFRGRKIFRAATVAAVSGWTLGVFSALALLSGIFDLSSLLLGIGMAFTAHVELKGSKAIRRFDLAAPRRLAINQAFLGVLLITYGVWGIYSYLTTPSPYAPYLEQGGQIAAALQPIVTMTTQIMIGFYTLVIVLSAMAQGCAAWYYASRARHLRAFLTSTEPWIIDTLRAAA